MTEYIEREAFHRMMVGLQRYVWEDQETGKTHFAVSSDDVNFGIKMLPTADVAPVRHGRWIPFHSEAAGAIQYCSVCEIGFPEKTDYCPHCGAKMDLWCETT